MVCPNQGPKIEGETDVLLRVGHVRSMFCPKRDQVFEGFHTPQRRSAAPLYNLLARKLSDATIKIK